MSAIERGLYVTVGAADLAAEKVRELPAVKFVVERTSKIRETSLIDQAREIEPKVRKQAEELQARGEQVVQRIRKDAKDFQQQLKEFPEKARKEFQGFPDNARKQATELRERVQKSIRRENGQAARDGGKPASKTSAAKATASSSKSAS